VIEVRWHARAGQGAKTASQLFALAELRSGRWVQAFPDYGPERGGAPMCAYTRVDDRPIRRRHPIAQPDAVVVIEPSLLGEVDVAAGLRPDGVLVVNAPPALADGLTSPGRLCVVHAAALAPARAVNTVMVGALAAVLGEPPLAALQVAARDTMGGRLSSAALAQAQAAIAAGHAAASAVLDAERAA
jgi:pyruvate ferredoxin oxidoreductase gamma subunit